MNGDPAAHGDFGGVFEGLVGRSSEMYRVTSFIRTIANVDATVLVSGESGTGKELVARALHYGGRRSGKPFVPVNCGALPDGLVESALFGHVKGAFTGASAETMGLVGEAAGGTLFLDEVDALSIAAQSKLLRFLQEREYRRVGCSRQRHADVRVVAATNADLPKRVQERQFRDDLYYRLNVLECVLPPLRERGEDVALLARHLLDRYVARYQAGQRHFSPSALERLARHHWPGNVRELESVIQRAVLLSPGPGIEADQLDLPAEFATTGEREQSFEAARACAIERFERSFITEILSAHRGNISHAARSAQTDRRTLQRLLRKHGIDRQIFAV